MKKIMIVAAHPDDEVLGCGGTIAKHIINGDEVNILILAEGITSRDSIRNKQSRKKDLIDIKKMSTSAHNILGSNSLKFLDFPDNRMDSVDLIEVIKSIEKEINKIQPEIIYTHHYGDLNIDHRITNQAVITACRPVPNTTVKKIFCFEIASSTEWQAPRADNSFNPNTFIDISNTLDKKMLALNEYSSEMRPWPHSRSLKAIEFQAKHRGASAGYEAAEAFDFIRNLID